MAYMLNIYRIIEEIYDKCIIFSDEEVKLKNISKKHDTSELYKSLKILESKNLIKRHKHDGITYIQLTEQGIIFAEKIKEIKKIIS